MTEDTGFAPEPDESQAETVEPDDTQPEPAAPGPDPVAEPDPEWLIEVKDNAQGILGTAVQELYKLIKG